MNEDKQYVLWRGRGFHRIPQTEHLLQELPTWILNITMYQGH